MKTILLLVHDDPGQEARLQTALDIVRALDGHLSCLHVTALTPLYGTSHGVAGGAMLLELERESEAANGPRIKARLAAEDVPWSWQEATGYLETALENASALADLIVVSGQLAAFPLPDMRALAVELVLKSRRPVLAVPEASRGLDVAGSALIAWDGSDEASAALAAALPLLRLADSVTLFETGKGPSSAEEAAVYLSRHAIAAQIVEGPEGSRDVAAELLARANGGDFDYLVLGGLRHSRLAEALFGGLTRTLLGQSRIPLFLAD